MANHESAHFTGPESIEDLTADREKTWAAFTSATTGAIIFMIVLLVGMAVLLL
jgi:hypothetical protein